MLGASGVQIPENNVDNLKSTREEDRTSEALDPQDYGFLKMHYFSGSDPSRKILLFFVLPEGCDLLALVELFTLVEVNKEIKEVNANCILMVNLQQASTSGTHDDKAPIYDSDGSAEFIPKVVEKSDLTKLVTSHSVPESEETKVVKNKKVIAPGMFRINPFKHSRVDNFAPNRLVKASVGTKPITTSQPHVINKKDVNSNINGLSSTGVESTTRSRRPQLKSNTKNDRVLYAFVNGMKSRGKNQKANVLNIANQKKHKANVNKTKKLGSKESLASHRARKPTGRTFDLSGKLFDNSNTKVENEIYSCDNASTSNPHEPITNGFQILLLFLASYQNLFMQRRLRLFQAYDQEFEDAHQLLLEVYGTFYNRKTKKIMEMMNVTYDELLAIAFEQRSSKPELQGRTSGHIFNYDDYIGGQSLDATRIAPAAPTTLNRQTPNASTTTDDTTPTPTNSSTESQAIPNTSQDVDKLQQHHFQQKLEQSQL
ncbi:hypothetical protein Tco_1538322 [Tanacetum coccineum]